MEVYFNKLKAFQNGNKVLDKYFKIIFGMQFQDDNRLNFRSTSDEWSDRSIYIFRTLRDTSTQVLKMWFIDNVCLWFFCLNEALVSKCWLDSIKTQNWWPCIKLQSIFIHNHVMGDFQRRLLRDYKIEIII